MSGNGPVEGVAAGGGVSATVEGAGGRSRAPWRVLTVAVALLVVLLVWHPWAGTPQPPPSPTPTPVETPTPTPTPTPSPKRTPVPTASPPGSATVFDIATAQGLFVTDQQLVETIPDAAAGVRRTIGPGQLAWGLPAGASVLPVSCTVARTVVELSPPGGYDARGYTTDTLVWVQEVTLLADPAAARTAFAALVTTVDRCPEYAQVTGPDTTGTDTTATWTADPAIEGQGLYPSIVQPLRTTAAARDAVGYRGHLLVGNAIVTWTVQTTGASGTDGLGPVDDLAAIVQDRALAAVRSLG